MDNTVRVHRVGSITTGISMIALGIAVLLHLIFDLISYEWIFRMWPLILIGLGIELLLSNFSKEKIIYDKAAIFLMFLVSFFAIGMAGMDIFMEYLSQ
nr:DUF5668 domain-containing protein [uncultured Butyrivibrio sp.]